MRRSTLHNAGMEPEALEARTLFAAALSSLVNFNGTNGETPYTIVQDNSGDLIGITQTGGPNDLGEIFRLPNANNPQLEILATFTGGAEGGTPRSLAMDAAGNIFGTTDIGGANNKGTIFKLPVGSSTLEKLRDLDDTTAFAKLAPFTDPAGNLYGTITSGIVFKIAAGTSDITTLSFVQGTINDLIIDPFGNLFGTTFLGGNDATGSIFKIPAGQTVASVVSFFSPAVGTGPNGLVVDSVGNLYGSTQAGGANGFGTVFTVAKDSSTIEVLGSFDGTNGSQPISKPALDNHGHLFGITHQGGANDSGVLYMLPDGGTLGAVLSLGPNEATLQAFSSAFGDIQSPIIANANASLDPLGWHFDYPPPPDGQPSPPTWDIPNDDNIRLPLPIGGPPPAGSFGGLGSIAKLFLDPNEEAPASLSVQILGNPPTSGLVGGVAKFPLKVEITNDAGGAVTQSATVKLRLLADGKTPGELNTKTVSLKLKAGQSKAVPIPILAFPSIDPGDYQLVAEVVDGETVLASATGPTITLGPPTIISAVSEFNPTKSSAVIGKKAAFSFRFTNNGNTPATGAVGLTALLSTDPAGADGLAVTTKPLELKVKLKPAAGRTFKLNITVPEEIAPGSYYLVLRLGVSAIGDTADDDGSLSASTLTPIVIS